MGAGQRFGILGGRFGIWAFWGSGWDFGVLTPTLCHRQPDRSARRFGGDEAAPRGAGGGYTQPVTPPHQCAGPRGEPSRRGALPLPQAGDTKGWGHQGLGPRSDPPAGFIPVPPPQGRVPGGPPREVPVTQWGWTCRGPMRAHVLRGGGQCLLGCPSTGSEELEASGGLWGCWVWGVPSCLVGGAGGQCLGSPQNFPPCQHRVPAATSQ